MTEPEISVQASVSGTGASAHSEQVWLQTDWRKTENEVRQVQELIAKAAQESRWGKVKALQRLLTRFYYGKLPPASCASKRIDDRSVTVTCSKRCQTLPISNMPLPDLCSFGWDHADFSWNG